MGDNTNKYVEELKKFNGAKVVVVDNQGEEHKGICLAINHMHLNTIVKTDNGEIIAFRNIRKLKRKG